MSTIEYTREGLAVVDAGGEPRVLGCHPSETVFSFPEFGANFPLLPRAQWKETSLKGWNVPVEDQSKFGSCTGEATESVFAYAWLVSGQKRQNFSSTALYALINGGRDQGASVSAALQAAMSVGLCLESEAPRGLIYKHQISAKAWETAKRFRVKSAFRIRSFDELGTAITRGFGVVSGIAVGNNFTRGELDSEGVAPLPDKIVGGHALASIGLKVTRRGNWVAETKNSWSARWGLAGYCFLQEEAWAARYGFGFDAFAVQSVYDDPADTGTDTPALA